MKSKAKRNLTTALKVNRSMLNEDKNMLKLCQDSKNSESANSIHASWPAAIPRRSSAIYNLTFAETGTRKSLVQGHLSSMIDQLVTEVERE